MTSSSTIRLDPLNDVMPYEMLKVAHSLIVKGQSEHYWMSVPTPQNPVGKLPFEVAQQVATFAGPLVTLVWAYQHHGMQGLLLGMPFAWFAGFLLDRRLERAIETQARHDRKLDAGRFYAVKWLSEQMGMRSEEVTLDVIRKMDKDFTIVQRIIDERVVQIAANKKAAATTFPSPRPISQGGYVSTDSSAYSVAAAHGTEYPAVVDVANHDSPTYLTSTTEYDLPYTELAFNPVSGLPMIEGTGIDIHGNMLGTNDQF